MTTAPLLTTRGLVAGYPHRRITPALDLQLRRGSLTVLLGANGCGKSTLLRTLCGVQPAIEGSVAIGGHDIRQMNAGELARSVSLVCTDRTLAGGLTVEETVALGRQPHTGFFGRLGRDDRRAVAEAMETMGIIGMRDRYTATLSDGERQKAMIARALAQATGLIVLDEPTSFLDVASRLDVMALLGRLARGGKTILLSTHDVGEALSVADEAWLMAADTLETGDISLLKEAGAFDRLFAHRGIIFDRAAGDYRLP